MSSVVDFHTKEEKWTLKDVLAIVSDLIDECGDEEEMNSVSCDLTIYELKLLHDAARAYLKLAGQKEGE